METLKTEDQYDRLLGALQSAFSPMERAWLESQPQRARRLSVYYLWTRKEAYLKALGVGIPGGLDHFSAIPNLKGAFEGVDDSRRGGATGWVATTTHADNGAVVSVCVLGLRPRRRLAVKFLADK